MSGLPLTLRDLSVAGDDGRLLLKNADMQVAAGDIVGIRGPSGAGKSTLLFALSGLQPKMTGSVLWGDTDLVRLGEAGRAAFRRRHIGLVFQDFLLFEELDALSNAALGGFFSPGPRARSLQDSARTLLSTFGLKEGKRRISSFSGGERQRVAMARALAGNPDIILADEPTASLDRDMADMLTTDLLDQVRNTGQTLIVVSHDDRLLGQMDRCVEIVDGQLREGGL